MLRLRVTPGSPFVTCMAIKAHSLKEGAGLFVSGIPLNFDDQALTAVFTCFGAVEQVVIHRNKAGGRACVGPCA